MLARRVRIVMTSHGSETIGEGPTRVLATGDTPDGFARLQPGTTVGRYIVIDRLGRGGMGEVARAYDPKLGREVALKRVRDDALSSEATARLLREAQSMAQLAHPNVVAVYDAEESEHGVVLAMEFVPGQTLATWLETKRRSIDEILDVFRQIGAGLSAAHRAGMVHRDVKPANILVGDDGRVRVGDFGIAKATSAPSMASRDPEGAATSSGPPSTSDFTLTRADQVLGTPSYMAPEQYQGAAATPAADQYATAVMLWLALCGRPPFSGNVDELHRAKRAGPPAWPKDVVAPRRVVEAIRRAMATRPEDRFESVEAFVAALSADRQRTRRLQGIAAIGAGIATVAGLAVLREDRPVPCAGAAAELTAVWNDDRRAEVTAAFTASDLPYAPTTLEGVLAGLDDYASAWLAEYREACEATVVRGDASMEAMELRQSCLRRARQDLRARVDALAAADAAIIERATRMIGGLPDTALCGDIETLRLEEPTPVDPALAAELDEVRAQLTTARVEIDAGRYGTALELANAALERAESAGAERLVADVLQVRGKAEDALGTRAAAEASFNRAFELTLSHGREKDAASLAGELAFLVGAKQARFDEGLRLANIGLAIARQFDDPGLEEKLLLDRGTLYYVMRRLADGEADVRRSIEIAERRGDRAAIARSNLAAILTTLGRSDEAIELMRALLEEETEHVGPTHPNVAHLRNNLGAMLAGAERFDEAEVEFRAAIEAREALLPADNPELASSYGNLGTLLTSAGRPRDGEVEHRRALAIFRKSLGPNHPDTLLCLVHLAGALRADARDDEAESTLREAATAAAGLPEHDHIRLEIERDLGLLLLDTGRHAEARPIFERVLAGYDRIEAPDPPSRAQAPWWLARALWDVRAERARAHDLARQTIERLRELGEDGVAAIPEVETWIREHPR